MTNTRSILTLFAMFVHQDMGSASCGSWSNYGVLQWLVVLARRKEDRVRTLRLACQYCVLYCVLYCVNTVSILFHYCFITVSLLLYYCFITVAISLFHTLFQTLFLYLLKY